VNRTGCQWRALPHDFPKWKTVYTVFWRWRRDGVCLRVVFADSAYGRNGLPAWGKEKFGWLLQTVLRPAHTKGFVVSPKRWIVERTFAWLIRCRQNSRDYERTTGSSETMIYLSMIALMPRRLAHTNRILRHVLSAGSLHLRLTSTEFYPSSLASGATPWPHMVCRGPAE
jgi:transposase